MNAMKIAKGLGWFSIGLGLAEVVAPKAMARYFDMERRTGLVRFFGMREIAAGAAILAQPSVPLWLWTRVAGDALDLTALGTGFGAENRAARRVWAAMGVVGAIMALDVITARGLAGGERA